MPYIDDLLRFPVEKHKEYSQRHCNITSPRNAPRNLWLYEKFQRDIGEREEDGPRKCQPERFRPPQPFEQGETHQKRVLSMWERLVGLKVTPAQPERRIKTAKAGSQRIDAPKSRLDSIKAKPLRTASRGRTKLSDERPAAPIPRATEGRSAAVHCRARLGRR
jgi:hypothetical protein